MLKRLLLSVTTLLLIIFAALSIAANDAPITVPTQPTTAAKQVTIQAKNPQGEMLQHTINIDQPQQATEQQPAHLWNLQNADIIKVIAEVSRETGKNFVVSPQVSGNITIISNQPLTAEEIYPVFLSSLQVLGYAAIPSGKLIKILPIRDANQIAPALPAKQAGHGDKVIVRTVQLQYVSAIQLVPILNPLIPTWANVSAYSPSNSIVISGTAQVVDRVLGIIQRVDTPSANGIDVVTLRYATAENVVKEVTKLLETSRNVSGDIASSMSADDRSNSVLISGAARTRLQLKVLVLQLDTPTQDDSSDTQVITLHYKPVESILPLLRGIAHQTISNTTNTSGSNTAAQPMYSSYGNNASGGNTTSDLNETKLNQISNAELNAGAGSDKDTNVVIVADVPSNAIIITAPPNLMRVLKSVIYQLDIRPKQILVQGIIAEVDASKLNQLGIEWGTSTSQTQEGGSQPSSPYSVGGGGMGIGFITHKSLTALVQAINSDTNSNILSTPSIMVLDNATADIEVGKTIPETSGQYQPGSGTNTQPYVSYDFKKIGLTLSVTPQITDDNSVRLIIAQANSSVVTDDSTAGGASNPNPTTNNESIDTTVMVKDSRILVLGGLMSTQQQTATTKVPVLGSIPLVGLLFQHKNVQTVKKDLLVFLRPVIINGPDSADQLSKAKYDLMRSRELINLNGNAIDENDSVLPSTNTSLPVPFSDTNDQ